MWNKYVKKTKQKLKREAKKGSGVKSPSGFLPCDPNALCERLELLMASIQAGNIGLRNEIVSICDELLRQKILPSDAHKKRVLTSK